VLRPFFDVLIVGGGPAGSATASALARAGKAVALVEKSSYDGRRIGETLTPAARPLLTALGVWQTFLDAGHLPAPGLVSVWGRTKPREGDFLANPYGDGWQLDRARFDHMLASAAAVAGARVLRQHAVVACTYDPGRGWTITVEGNDGPMRLGARLILDAAGRRTWPGRPARRRRVVDRLVAVVGYLTVDGGEMPDRRTLVEAAPNGWWYSAPLPDRTLVAAYFTDSQLARRHGALSEQTWFKLARGTGHTSRRIGAARLQLPLRMVPANSSIATPLAAPAWLAVGNAASTFDPLSGQGIYQALLTAIHAAHIIATSLDCGAVPWQAYAQEVTERFERYLEIRDGYYRMEDRWPDEPFWRRFRRVGYGIRC
jgi:flavin-dependent dehydrogenase